MSKKTGQQVIDILTRPFESNQIESRPGGWNPKTGKNENYVYVPSEHVITRLREAFGLSYSVKVLGNERKPEEFIAVNNSGKKEVVVMVSLEYTDPDTGVRESVPGVGSKGMTGDLGADFKASLSKAIANAAKKIGVAADLADVEEAADSDSATPGVTPGGITPSGGGIAPASSGSVAAANTTPPVQSGGGITPGGGIAPSGGGIAPAAQNTVKPEQAPAQTTGGITANSKPVESPAPQQVEHVVASSGGIAPATQTTVATEPEKTGTVASDHTCSDCKGAIIAAVTNEGHTMSPEDIMHISQTFFGRQLCNLCIKEEKKKMKAAKG